MKRLGIWLLLLAASLPLGPAFAGSAIALRAAIDNCQNPKVAPDIRIEMCTRIIHANVVSHGILTAFYAFRASAYADKQDLSDAIQDYSKAIELKSDFPEALANRANLYDQIGATAQASRDYERAGFFRLKKYECKEAIEDYTAALQHDAKLATALYGRGLCEFHGGDSNAGQADLAAARRLDSGIEKQADWPEK